MKPLRIWRLSPKKQVSYENNKKTTWPKDKKGKKQKRKKKKKSYDLLINLGASFSPSLEMFFPFLTPQLHCFSIQVLLYFRQIAYQGLTSYTFLFLFAAGGGPRSERLRLLLLMSNCFQFFFFRWVFHLAKFLGSLNCPQKQRQQRCKDAVKRKLIFLSASLLRTRLN